LYEEASTVDYRKKLPDIRKGEYEGLADRITKPEWKPDFGPAGFIPEWGATLPAPGFSLLHIMSYSWYKQPGSPNCPEYQGKRQGGG